MEPFLALEQHRALIQRHDENSARLAQSFATYTTTGWGEFKDPTVIDFGCTFLKEPTVAHGYSTNGDNLVTGRFPRCWGFVHAWRQDHRGYYTGCWVSTIVETQSAFIPTSEPEPKYSIDHCFTFTAIAIKDLPVNLLEQ